VQLLLEYSQTRQSWYDVASFEEGNQETARRGVAVGRRDKEKKKNSLWQ
jgi:hypothetical protein